MFPPVPPLLAVEALACIARPNIVTVLSVEMTVTSPPCPFCKIWLACTAKAGIGVIVARRRHRRRRLPRIVMAPFARRSIQLRPCVPPAVAVSALTSPLWVPVLSISSVVPAQISTHAPELAGLPGRFTLQRLANDPSCAGPVDATSPRIWTTHACRCTRSAPGSLPLLMTSPVSPTTRSQHASMVIGPPRPIAVVPSRTPGR